MLQKYLFFLAFLGAAGTVLAEGSSEPGGNSGAGSGNKPGASIYAPFPGAWGGSTSLSPGNVKALDNDFFLPKKEETTPIPPGISRKGREYAPEPDYNSEQRDLWLQKCASYRDKDARLFRQCYQKEREKMLLELREKFDAIERRQGAGKVPTEELLQPNKASGGFD
ncbi:MAG: hypothetical protein EBQ85_10325 [Proteobacteria bacterium]|nr:hypothetical protein [Pseudomonadota bacterium]